MPQARRRTVSRGTTRRKFIWARSHEILSGTDESSAADLLGDFETTYGAQLIGCTIVRIRGLMYANADAGAGTTNSFKMAARVASGQVDITAPIPAAQSPFGDEYADWMLWEPFIQSVTTTGEVGDVGIMRMIDVRSSRKLEELGESLLLFVASNPAAPLITWSFGWDLSIGVKLP